MLSPTVKLNKLEKKALKFITTPLAYTTPCRNDLHRTHVTADRMEAANPYMLCISNLKLTADELITPDKSYNVDIEGNLAVFNESNIEKEYPDLIQLLPKGKPVASVTVDTAYLKSILANAGEDVTITIYNTAKNEPIEIQSSLIDNNNDYCLYGLYAILMPRERNVLNEWKPIERKETQP